MPKFEKGNDFGKGRPKGSRNRTVLSQAQKLADDSSLDCVRMWRGILLSDADTCAEFGIDVKKIKATDKMAASKELRGLSTNGFKELEKPEEKKPVQVQRPHLQLTATLKKAG